MKVIFPKFRSLIFVSAVLAGVFGLTACNPYIHTGKTVEAVMPKHYGMVIETYKDGQFMLGGALLSKEELASHFRYLQETKKLPKTVLLKPSEKYDIKNPQLRWFAGLQLSFGFIGYADLDGNLTLVNARPQAKQKKN